MRERGWHCSLTSLWMSSGRSSEKMQPDQLSSQSSIQVLLFSVVVFSFEMTEDWSIDKFANIIFSAPSADIDLFCSVLVVVPDSNSPLIP